MSEIGLPTIWEYGVVTTGFSGGIGYLKVNGRKTDVLLLDDGGRHFEMRDGLPTFSKTPVTELPKKNVQLAFKPRADTPNVALFWGLVSELRGLI